MRSTIFALPLLLLASCVGPADDGSSTARIDVISDGHHGGNPGFDFLPPIVPRPPLYGANDATAQPTLTIERLDTQATIATYTRSGGSDGEHVRLHVKDVADADTDGDLRTSFFVVRWHTGDFGVVAGQSYRVHVSVGATELGYADIDVVASGKQGREVDRMKAGFVIAGNTLRIKWQIAPARQVCSSLAFTATATSPTGDSPVYLRAGDLDEDGVADFASADYYTGVGVQIGDGSGGVEAAPEASSQTGQVNDISIADFDGDGHLDAEVTDFTHSSLELFHGFGTGRFAASQLMPLRADAIQSFTGDANNDGIPDLVIANLDATVDIELGNGDGTFGAPVTYDLAAPFERPGHGQLVDVDGDGLTDLVLANNGAGVDVLLGTGGGVFGAVARYSTGTVPFDVVSADIDGDGRLDLIAANRDSGDIAVLLGRGDGTFATALATPVGASPAQIATADFDGDGHVDVAVADQVDNVVHVLRGHGDGTFDGPVDLASGNNTTGVVAVDADGDGKPDVAAVAQDDNTFTLFTNSCN